MRILPSGQANGLVIISSHARNTKTGKNILLKTLAHISMIITLKPDNDRLETMKKLLHILFALVLQVQLVCSQDTIRIMTINIDHGVDTTIQCIGERIRYYHPDLVAVQEVDIYPRRMDVPLRIGRNFISELSYYTNMHGVFGKALGFPPDWDYGDAILSRYSFTKSETTIFKNNNGAEPRQLLMIHTSVKGHDICFASTHLCHESVSNRTAQLKQVRQIMQRQKEKIRFVCGDLNSDVRENLVHNVMRNWHDALPEEEGTFSSLWSHNYKAYKYDYILYNDMNSKLKIEVIQNIIDCDAGITDHCICIADIVIK